jgi:TfoX/Sxy family transcriptional regulator of competence genes
MTSWRKAPSDLVEAFAAALPLDEAVQRRQMFGYSAAFVNGNMFAGLHQENVVVRLSEEGQARARAAGAASFAPMGRAMLNYVALPQSLSSNALAAWLEEAFRYTAALPLKEAKPRKRKQ